MQKSSRVFFVSKVLKLCFLSIFTSHYLISSFFPHRIFAKILMRYFVLLSFTHITNSCMYFLTTMGLSGQFDLWLLYHNKTLYLLPCTIISIDGSYLLIRTITYIMSITIIHIFIINYFFYSPSFGLGWLRCINLGIYPIVSQFYPTQSVGCKKKKKDKDIDNTLVLYHENISSQSSNT